MSLRALTLREARCSFTLALSKLVLYAQTIGYQVAFDEVTEHLTTRDPTSDHTPGSLHHLGLAGDLILYKDGLYLSASEDYEPLGLWWVQYGIDHELPLAWGGNFTKPDGNHFSLAWKGRQ